MPPLYGRLYDAGAKNAAQQGAPSPITIITTGQDEAADHTITRAIYRKFQQLLF